MYNSVCMLSNYQYIVIIDFWVIGRSKFFEAVNEILETLEWGGLRDAIKGVDFYFYYYNNN